MSADPTGPWGPFPPAPGALPASCDVLVVGGGLAGMLTATFLAEAGVDVVVVEARTTLGSGAAGRCLGLGFRGLVEHPYRLVHALGEHDARELFEVGGESLTLLSRWAPDRSGIAWAALDDREPEQLELSLAALTRLGVAAEMWTADQVQAHTGAASTGPALYVPDELGLDPGALVRALAGCGAPTITSARVTALRDVAEGVEVQTTVGTVRAEVVVLAASTGLPALADIFLDTITPVREAALMLVGDDGPSRVPLRAGYGWTRARAVGRHRLVGGCRWATPHLEVGEDDDSRVDPRVADKLRSTAARLFPGATPGDTWAWLIASTCDGLPIVGPLPGDVRRLACTGFCGNELGLAPFAARGVADALLTGTHHLPARWSPMRFV